MDLTAQLLWQFLCFSHQYHKSLYWKFCNRVAGILSFICAVLLTKLTSHLIIEFLRKQKFRCCLEHTKNTVLKNLIHSTASEVSRSGEKVTSLDSRQALAGVTCVLDPLGLCSQEGDIWLDGILHTCQLHQRSKRKSQHVRTLCGFVTLSWGFRVHKPMNGLQRNIVIVFSAVTDSAAAPSSSQYWMENRTRAPRTGPAKMQKASTAQQEGIRTCTLEFV